jgi:hypothetical protein
MALRGTDQESCITNYTTYTKINAPGFIFAGGASEHVVLSVSGGGSINALGFKMSYGSGVLLCEGYHENRGCSRDTYPESYITRRKG